MPAFLSAAAPVVMSGDAIVIWLAMDLVTVVIKLITPVLQHVSGIIIMQYVVFISLYIAIIADCTDGLIRLVDGSDEFEGRLEMCVDGKWGTVCDNGFSTIDAVKACAQLKLPTDSKFV